MRKVFVASLLAVSIAASSGCQQLGISKTQAGTVIGAAVGLAVGATMGKGTGKIVASIIAGSIGGYIGNKIGSMLDEKDKQALALRTQEALNDQQSGTAMPIAWKSEHSGASAQIVQGQEFKQNKTFEVKRAPKIAAVPTMKLINEPYVTVKSSNVRSAPNINADKVGGLKPGT